MPESNKLNSSNNVVAGRAQLLVRTDAGERIGIGHIMRCLSIADAWTGKGGKVRFLVSPLPSSLELFLQSFNLDMCIQDAEPGSTLDARNTLSMAEGVHAAWTIVDGYWFGPEFQKTVKSGTSRLLLVDPLGTPQHNYADIIVNANIYANDEYYHNIEPQTRLLLGPAYLPIRPEFTRVYPVTRDRTRPPENILVSLGGSDPENVTGQVLQYLFDLPADIHCNILLGPANKNLENLQGRLAGRGQRFTLLQASNNMQELLARTDIAILAGGSTVWEALYMGIPTLLVSYADNQLRVAPKLAEAGYALYCGHFSGRIPAKFAHDLNLVLTDGSLRGTLSMRGKLLVDGRGIERIIHAMLADRTGD